MHFKIAALAVALSAAQGAVADYGYLNNGYGQAPSSAGQPHTTSVKPASYPAGGYGQAPPSSAGQPHTTSVKPVSYPSNGYGQAPSSAGQPHTSSKPISYTSSIQQFCTPGYNGYDCVAPLPPTSSEAVPKMTSSSVYYVPSSSEAVPATSSSSVYYYVPSSSEAVPATTSSSVYYVPTTSSEAMSVSSTSDVYYAPSSEPTYVSSTSSSAVYYYTKPSSSEAVSVASSTPCPEEESSKAGKPTSQIPGYMSPSSAPVETTKPYTTKTNVYTSHITTKPCEACNEMTYTQVVSETVTVPCEESYSTPVYTQPSEFSTISYPTPTPISYTTETSTRTHTYYSTVTVPSSSSTPVNVYTVPSSSMSYASTVTQFSTVVVHTQGTYTQTVTYQTPASYSSPSVMPTGSCPGGYSCPVSLTTSKVPTYTPIYTPTYPAGNSTNGTVPVSPPAYTGSAGKTEIMSIFAAGAIMAIAAMMNL